MIWACAISPKSGAITQLYAAADPEIVEKGYKGKYFVPYATLAKTSAAASDPSLAADTWKTAETILKDKFDKKWAYAV
jgi:hypothetical protein